MKAIKSAIGEHVHKSFSFMTAKNEFHSVVVYWKDGKAVSKNELPPKVANAVRFACISDTHCKTSQFVLEEELLMPDCDVILHAGDFTGTGTNAQTKEFGDFCRHMKRPMFVIAGNRETQAFCFYYKDRGCVRFHQGKFQDGDPRKLLPPNVTYLQDSQSSFKDISIYGSPWQPEFCDWAFNLMRLSEELDSKWKAIPNNTEVLITHGPAHGKVGGNCVDGFDAGCELLTKRILEFNPLIHVCGHIHESYGCYFVGKTISINASSVNYSYKPTNPPIVFDMIKN